MAFEQLTQHCCNYSRRICIGAFFKLAGGEFHHWINRKFANKPCQVIQGENCLWFAEKVIPGIIETDKNLALIKKWEEHCSPNNSP